MRSQFTGFIYILSGSPTIYTTFAQLHITLFWIIQSSTRGASSDFLNSKLTASEQFYFVYSVKFCIFESLHLFFADLLIIRACELTQSRSYRPRQSRVQCQIINNSQCRCQCCRRPEEEVRTCHLSPVGKMIIFEFWTYNSFAIQILKNT